LESEDHLQEGVMGQRRRRSHEERGFILVLSLLFLLVVTLLAVSGMNTAVYETRLSGNKRISEQAFYVAEAGIHEFMGRYGSPSSVETFDPSPSDPDWKLFLATHEERAREIGYRSSGSQSLVQSLQNQLDFAVEVRHKVNPANHAVTSRGYPVYVVTSHGHAPDFGLKVVEVEVNRGPSIDAPSALYSKAPVNLRGSSTLITGMDQCGTENKPGIITTSPVINESGNPKVLGTTPEMTSSDISLPLKDMIDYLKEWADFTYRYPGDQTLTGYLDAWGVPTGHGTGTPLSYPDTSSVHVVYFDMGESTLKLSGGSHGAGLLLVNGNLEINGGFNWYGIIIVKGGMTYSGGGENNITGAVLSANATVLHVDVGGNISILFCSDALRRVREWVSPLRIVQWREAY
jgi:hypothetical protein